MKTNEFTHFLCGGYVMKIAERRMWTVVAVLSALILAGSVRGAVEAQAPIQVIATGLDNPRGLNFGPDGALYVTEAGRGGSSTACAPSPDPPFANRCFGPTGAITRIGAIGDQRRVVVGLPSIAGPSGAPAQGPVDIDFGLGAAWVTIGFAGDPANRAPLEAAGARMGRLIRVLPNGQWNDVVDISAHEAATNPDATTVDSNPFGLRILPDRALIADPGANALLQVGLNGAISTLAVFPARAVPSGDRTFQSVPTSVAVGANGEIYVGELTGQPFLVGAARVYRVPAGGGVPTVVATGFTNIIDIAVAADGAGYVLEHDADGILGPGVDGRVIRVNADGTRTVIASAGLVKPGGLAVGPDGALYVTTRSNSAGIGAVVRIQP